MNVFQLVVFAPVFGQAALQRVARLVVDKGLPLVRRKVSSWRRVAGGR
jgi:hypothetical protein